MTVSQVLFILGTIATLVGGVWLTDKIQRR